MKVDVTSGGNFTAIADNDNNDVRDFTLDSAATVTCTGGSIDVTAFNITDNGTFTANISGSVTLTETSATSAEQETQVDQGTNSTFVQDFTSPTEAGC